MPPTTGSLEIQRLCRLAATVKSALAHAASFVAS
jgi:hypothetical protein